MCKHQAYSAGKQDLSFGSDAAAWFVGSPVYLAQNLHSDLIRRISVTGFERINLCVTCSYWWR